MKWLIILGLLFALIAVVGIRYRRQIQMALYVLKMFRKMREMGKEDVVEKKIDRQTRSADIPLVRCARCGTWKPQNDALKFGGNIFYCSSNCMEKAVRV